MSAALTLAVASVAGAQVQTVMTGLNNPYGLAFAPDGSLYVAEAGTGNNGLGTGPGFVDGNNVSVYYGATGSISRLQGGTQARVVTGLPSLAPAGGGETTGLQGLAFGSDGSLYGAFGLGGIESQRTQLVAAVLTANGSTAGTTVSYLGQIVRFNVSANSVTPVSDMVPYETANYTTNNPDSTAVEANPYGLIMLPGGGFAVSEGGGNVVLKVPAGGGSPTLLAAIHAMNNSTGIGGPTYQSVPTGLALDSAGKLYVGQFTGFPFPVGGASVLGINQSTGVTTPYATGFTTITGIAFGPNGDLYVLDNTTNGLLAAPSAAQLFQYDPTSGHDTLLATLPAGVNYTSMIAGPDNALYISDDGTGAGSGSVLRVSLVPEPAAAGLLAATLLLGRRRTR